jgi:pseudouridine synthase
VKERLQKVLAAAGVCSRREAERLIELGEVSVNGATVRRLGTKVDPEVDHLEVAGRRVRSRVKRPHVYLALHKPRGYVTTAKDPEGRPTVLDLLAGYKERVYPVGRLDYNAEGLLLLTNDGDLAYALMRPGGVAKTYRVKVRGTPPSEALDRLRRGPTLDGTRLLPMEIRVLSRGETAWLLVTLHEGRKNQIVRMLDAVGHPVRRLRRVSLGPVRLGTLPSGRWRALEAEEIAALRRQAERVPKPKQGARRPGSRSEDV